MEGVVLLLEKVPNLGVPPGRPGVGLFGGSVLVPQTGSAAPIIPDAA